MKNELSFPSEIRDPIHGLIPITRIEADVINTPAFQRLRNIKQLALANLGFHGAVHTRFGHSIGVMHVAYKIIQHLVSRDEIDIDPDTIQNIRLAGLLHDIGHGPFSHISEYLLDHFNENARKDNNTEEIHELISRNIIQEDKDLKDHLGKKRRNEILQMLETNRADADYRHDIVSGSLDGDKMDYLLRDSYYAGVKYGVFDIERMINVLTLINENGRHRLAIKIEGVQAVEQYILAKYFMAQQVYQHKIRKITDLMIFEGIKDAVNNGNKDLKKLYEYKNTNDYVKYYLGFDDWRVFDTILNNAQKTSLAYIYFQRLKDRNLLKRLYYSKIMAINSLETLQAINKLEKIKHNECDSLRQTISQIADLDERFTHISVFSLKVPLYQRSFGIIDEESMRIKRGENDTVTLENESPLFNILIKDAKLWYISVIGSPKKELTETKKEEIAKQIRKNLVEYFGG